MNDKWTWNFDVYDESDSPTKEGYYRIIDDEGNEMVDYFFGEPRMTPYGIGYWRNCKRPIIAWKIAEQTEPPTIDAVEVVRCRDCKWYNERDGCFFSTAEVDADGFCSYGERRSDV